jgi:hypothetical protein
MAPATLRTVNAASLAGDRQPHGAQKQQLDAKEGEELGCAERLVACVDDRGLRRRLLRQLGLLVGRVAGKRGRARTERRLPRRQIALRRRRARNSKQGKRDRYHYERPARDRGMGVLC